LRLKLRTICHNAAGWLRLKLGTRNSGGLLKLRAARNADRLLELRSGGTGRLLKLLGAARLLLRLEEGGGTALTAGRLELGQSLLGPGLGKLLGRTSLHAGQLGIGNSGGCAHCWLVLS
jgi:hypothetical protein